MNWATYKNWERFIRDSGKEELIKSLCKKIYVAQEVKNLADTLQKLAVRMIDLDIINEIRPDIDPRFDGLGALGEAMEDDWNNYQSTIADYVNPWIDKFNSNRENCDKLTLGELVDFYNKGEFYYGDYD